MATTSYFVGPVCRVVDCLGGVVFFPFVQLGLAFWLYFQIRAAERRTKVPFSVLVGLGKQAEEAVLGRGMAIADVRLFLKPPPCTTSDPPPRVWVNDAAGGLSPALPLWPA